MVCKHLEIYKNKPPHMGDAGCTLCLTHHEGEPVCPLGRGTEEVWCIHDKECYSVVDEKTGEN